MKNACATQGHLCKLLGLYQLTEFPDLTSRASNPASLPSNLAVFASFWPKWLLLGTTFWDMSASISTLRPVQVLAGHDKSVKCVALSAELDMAVSGSEDGTVNIYSIKEGQFMRFLKPPNNAPEMDFVVSKLTLSSQGHVVVSGHSREVHSLHVYTINGRLLQTQTVLHRTTSLLILDHEHILHGDENGELTVRDLYDGEIIHSVPLQMPIQGACLVARNTHLLVPLRDGKLIVVGSKIKH